MGGTQTWMTGLIIYFMFLFVIVSVMSAGGLLSSHVVTNTDFVTGSGSYNGSASPSSLGGFSWGVYFTDIFSFFVWDINVYGGESVVLAQYFWVFRVFFVWFPWLLLLISFYYSLPTVSG